MSTHIHRSVRSVLFIPMMASLLSLGGCAQEEPDVTPAVARVKVFEVGKQTRGQKRHISGKVKSPDRSTLSFGVGGRIEEISVEQGEFVDGDALLARLDQEPLQISLQIARANVSAARANFLDAQTNLKRFEELEANGVSSEAEVDTAKVKVAASEGELQLAEGNLENAQLDLERSVMKTPYSGSIVTIDVDDFQEVGPTTPVIVLQSDQSLGIDIRVPETIIQQLSYGQVVEIDFPSIPGLQLQGEVSTIGAESETGNAFPVRILLTETDERVRAGMTAGATFWFDDYLEDRFAYLIPLSAVAVDAGMLTRPENMNLESREAPVFVLNTETGKLELRRLVVGDLLGNEVEVFEGLNEGDLVVSAGVAFAREGMEAQRWMPETGAAYETPSGDN
jgi:RND family efflux transporter MFP subunit